ncbi:KamA family radical SAM protein [Candidatus Endoriftia persephonae]|uniref:Lysine 2,3-aminomutase n=2 Tax=Gammaproteobacteria TaxID=1236 RepID=G2FJW8_9GAMM|nr:KamA family radical SAM protein [Candidatus Endoriftia persephone]EGW52909.1 lysine 2,3-aminomutase [endosymbiont of Tevnia jerichonana (vent Tica)]USF86386.1 KamA family radical SAM protein [Candidatus Endoriftia persephone]
MSNLDKLKKIDWKSVDWQSELKQNINSIDSLKHYIDLSEDEEEMLREVVGQHPMNIPRYYLSLLNEYDTNDPIRKLALPSEDELIVAGSMGETTKDPYGDDKHNKGNGVLHKYPYSALIVATDYCSMYCRHCFRKAIVGLPNDKTVENFQRAATYIREHKEITNVIISGGDPLLINTRRIKKILESLVDIDHVNYVRIGTRTPVVYPMRFFDDDLLKCFEEFNKHKTLYLPTHFNHANEITNIAKEAVLRIRQTGVTVNNQAVLLEGVNDSASDIENLMNGLVTIGVNPYYLYQCMPVSRVRHHFQVPLKKGIDIVDEAKLRLDGYAKRFKFIMGHDIGKIEICGRISDKLILKQIHSRPEEPENASRMMVMALDDKVGWLDDMREISL